MNDDKLEITIQIILELLYPGYTQGNLFSEVDIDKLSANKCLRLLENWQRELRNTQDDLYHSVKTAVEFVREADERTYYYLIEDVKTTVKNYEKML